MAFLALWHSSKIIYSGREVKGKTTRSVALRLFGSKQDNTLNSTLNGSLSFTGIEMKGYNSIKVGLAPVQDLFNSRSVLPSRLALSNQRRVSCKQDSFWGSCVSILYLPWHEKTFTNCVWLFKKYLLRCTYSSQKQDYFANLPPLIPLHSPCLRHAQVYSVHLCLWDPSLHQISGHWIYWTWGQEQENRWRGPHFIIRKLIHAWYNPMYNIFETSYLVPLCGVNHSYHSDFFLPLR